MPGFFPVFGRENFQVAVNKRDYFLVRLLLI